MIYILVFQSFRKDNFLKVFVFDTVAVHF